MTHFKRFIIGLGSTAFLLAGFLNNQLTWNKQLFTAPTQEIVMVDSHPHSINTVFNAHLIQTYTDKKTNEFYAHNHGANVVELGKFFGMVK